MVKLRPDNRWSSWRTCRRHYASNRQYFRWCRSLEILEGCDKAFVSGFVIGAVAPPTKIVTTKIGALTVAKEVYDVGKAVVSVAQGAAGYAAGKVYEKVKEYFSSSQTESQP